MICRTVKRIFAVSLVIVVCTSCAKETLSNLGSAYKAESLAIQKEGAILELATNEYRIKVEASLALPDSSSMLACKRIKYDAGYYFLQCEGKNQTIMVFDSVGNYVSRLGERGRSRNEYQSDITDWFCASGSDDVVVYEKNSRKVHIFSIDGAKSESFILKSWPNAVGMTERGKLFCSFYQKEAKDGLQFGLLSEDEEVVRPLIYLGQDMEFVPSDLSFYKVNDRLFYVPCFADSAIVIRGDSIEKTVKLDFEERFITKEAIADAYRDKLDKYRDFKGVKYVDTYYETSEYAVIRYVCGDIFVNQLVNRKDGRQYRFASALPEGLFPSSVFCVRGNKMYYLFTRESVGEVRVVLNSDIYSKELAKGSKVVQDILNGKVQLPAVVSIEIK